MLKHSPTTAGTVSAAALFASGSRYANWAVSVAPFAPDLASIYVGRPREGREVVRGSCIVGRPDGPGPARRQRGLWGVGRTVSARTPGSLLPDSRFDGGRGGRAPGDPPVGLAGPERVRGTSIAQKLAVSRRNQSVPRCLASMAEAAASGAGHAGHRTA